MKGSGAPIRKMGNGQKPWMADFRYIGGKREFFATKALAETAREEQLLVFRNHGTSALSLTVEKRGEFIRAEERLQAIGLTVSEAVEFCERHYRSFTPMEMLQAVREMHQLKVDTNKRERSADAFRYTLKAFAGFVGDTKLVSEVTRQDCERWLFRSGWAPYTIRSKLIDLQTFFNAAKARGWAANVATDGIERIQLDDKPPGILSVEQCRALLMSAKDIRPEFCGVLALALFCGIRPEEVTAMQLAHVNIDGGHAEVTAEVSKTRQRRLVEISENAREWMRVGLALPVENYRGKMNAVRLATGFQGYKKKRVGGRETWVQVEGAEWPHDCLRHSFASYHLAMYGSADKTATQMGHRSTEMLFRHYRELVTREDAETFWKISPATKPN